MARDARAEDMPAEWTGLDPQDADVATAAGLAPDTAGWAEMEAAARTEFEAEFLADDLRLAADRAAHEATRPDRERVAAGRWMIELCHHVRTTGKWTASIFRAGSGAYEGLRNVYPESEGANPEWRGYPDRETALEAARAAVAASERVA